MGEEEVLAPAYAGMASHGRRDWELPSCEGLHLQDQWQCHYLLIGESWAFGLEGR